MSSEGTHPKTIYKALTREWLVTDGRGGYASGTVPGPNTRRYHGLLVAPLAPPVGRHVLLNKLEETLTLGERAYPLSANEFEGGHISPQGYANLESFRLEEGLPVWRYRGGEATLEKRVWMARGRTVTYISYTLIDGAPEARLTLTPLCSFRDFHHETVGSDDWHFRVVEIESGVTVRAYAGATPYHLLVKPPAGREWTFGGQRAWWWHFLHREELARGQDCLDDAYAIGQIDCTVGVGETLLIAATIEDSASVVWPELSTISPAAPKAGTSVVAALDKPKDTVNAPSSAGQADPFVAQLRRAANQMLVARPIPGEPTPLGPDGVPEARTVLAGYHWFGDWGRDTFIALPGLALATGRYAECREIVRMFARYVDRGMLPNRFPDSGAPLNDGDYNTIDAPMWFFHAVHALDRLTGGGLVAQVYDTLASIVDWHVQGTRFGIRVDPKDGLIRADNPQLTWMDAKVGDWVCTPRDGKPVEIAALWHHALSLMEVWARLLNRPVKEMRRFNELRVQAADGFETRFWHAGGGYLFDTIDGAAGEDASLRPNQIIAASLPDAPLSDAQRKSIVDVVADRLWTPRGLRTLDPADPRYRPEYSGDVWSRDGAYHQGTVWPWLLGCFVDAHLLVYRDKAMARRFVEPFQAHLFDESCAGSINEIFDADPPHAPRGCIAQAWSVSEVYRAWMATEH
jgi:glycogen debranching enzyme